MANLKEQIIRLSLMFLSRYLPLGQARLATLGGRGIEAGIWSEHGIPSNHGWLIERGQQFERLAGHYRYRLYRQLATFDRALAKDGRSSIDFLHLDLCGTFSGSAIESFIPVIPLIFAGSGRCLMVTVADARRNLVLEQWSDIERRAEALFGKTHSGEIYSRLIMHQRRVPVRKDLPKLIKPFDPEKAARRELGLLVELTELLRAQKSPWTPVDVERYIYVGRYRRGPFRMRTYFFHFGMDVAESPELAFAQAWAASKLSFANGDGFREVKAPSVDRAVQPSPRTSIGGPPEKEKRMKGKLQTIVSAVGGEAQQEFEALIAAAENGKMSAAFTKGLEQIAEIVARLLGNAHRSAGEGEISPKPAPIENGELAKVQVDLLRAKAEGSSDKAYNRAFAALGLTGRKHAKDRRRIVGAHLARTQGKHRANFIKRVVASQGEAALPELASLYSKIEGKVITPELLKKEAEAAK